MTGCEGEQGVVGRVWSRTGYADRVYEGEQGVVGRVWSRAGNAARPSMKESRVWWEECGAGLEMLPDLA